MYSRMDIKKYILKPLVGDSTLKPPEPYKFSKVMLSDNAAWMETLTTCGEFDESPQEIFHRMIYPKIAGYLVRVKDQIVGCTSLSMFNGFPTMMYLWVHPEHRRKHIAWFLANMCILRAKANQYMQIRTLIYPDNIPALELITKLGFVEKDPSLGG